jgi:hypothetical protein
VNGKTVDRYDFRFSSVTGPVKNPDTILSYGLGTEVGPITTIGDARQNFTQTYSVAKNGVVLASGIPVPPPNVGVRTTPSYNDPATGKALSGATTAAELDTLTAQGIRSIAGGVAVWAVRVKTGFMRTRPGSSTCWIPEFWTTTAVWRMAWDRTVEGWTGSRGSIC